jgi:hypothetical protein
MNTLHGCCLILLGLLVGGEFPATAAQAEKSPSSASPPSKNPLSVEARASVSNKISFRIHCPDSLIAGGPDRLFWIKCELTNEEDHALRITNRARFFLTDQSGKAQQCLRRVAENTTPDLPFLDYTRLVGPKQTSSWWESGQLDKEGHYRLHAVLDDLNVETPTVEVDIAFSGSSLFAELRRHFDEFPLVVPNSEESLGTYHWVAFTNDPVILNGDLYHAFRFEAPGKPFHMDWSFIMNPDTLHLTWYIGSPERHVDGFTDFSDAGGASGVPGLTGKGDLTIFQKLPAENLKRRDEYCIWFKPMHGMLQGLMVSFNFTTNAAVVYRATPEAVRERSSHRSGPEVIEDK